MNELITVLSIPLGAIVAFIFIKLVLLCQELRDEEAAERSKVRINPNDIR